MNRDDMADLLVKPFQGASEFLVIPYGYGHDEEELKSAENAPAPKNFSGLGGSAITLGAPSSEILVDDSIDVPGEFDLFSVALVAGETYTFSAYGSGADPLLDTFLEVYDPSLAFLDFDDDGGAGFMSQYTFTAPTTDTYYFAVGAFPGSGLTGDYTVDVAQQGPDVPDTFTGAATLTLGDVTYGFIDSGAPGPYGPNYGEVDTYTFEAEAGKIHTFEIAGGSDYNSDWFALPPGEVDPVAVIYDEFGNTVAFGDDVNFPDDLSAPVSFFAEEAGTYYLDVFSWAPWEGGYSITSDVVDPSSLDILDSIDWASANNVPFDATNTATVYFAEAGNDFGEGLPSLGWNQFEQDQVMLALEEYSKVIGTNYEVTTDESSATFRLFTTNGPSATFGAYMYPQDPAFGPAQGISAYNTDSGAWTFDQQQSLEQGGFAFAVILHEFGHGHGLAHPHDTGGGSDILLGVTGSTGSYGVYDLNQGVYTVMSYNDAWPLHPDGPTPFTVDNVDSGWSGTLSALDIAALQDRYGASAYATGDDVYELGDANDPGVYYETIWDTGGTDEIRYSGSRDAQIDLLAATIDYSPTGGGALSFVRDIWGGFTIARGVEIENATGGDGNDVILGNDLDNMLMGGLGDDMLFGRGGSDMAVYDGTIGEFSFYDGPDGEIFVQDNEAGNGDEGLDELWDIETLVFAGEKFTAEEVLTFGVPDPVELDVINVNDWFNPNWGGGFNATFELTLTDEIIDRASVSAWELAIDFMDPAGDLVSGWMNGFNATVDFDPSTDTFSTAGQGYQLELFAGDTLRFTVQGQGTGFDPADFAFTFNDIDPEPVVPSADDSEGLVIDASGLNDWGAGAVQQVSVENTGANTVDDWEIKLDLDPGELANIAISNAWGVTYTDDGEDLFFSPLSWNDEINPGGSANFGFQANILDNGGADWDAGDFMFV